MDASYSVLYLKVHHNPNGKTLKIMLPGFNVFFFPHHLLQPPPNISASAGEPQRAGAPARRRQTEASPVLNRTTIKQLSVKPGST